MTTPTIAQITELLQSNISDADKTALELIKSLPTNQQTEAMHQFQRLCAQANTNQDGVALNKYARAMFTSARISQDDIGKTVAFYYAAVAEYHQQKYKECISRLDRTFQEINRITDEQSQHLLANTHYLYAFTCFHLREYTKAKQHADSALTLYQQQQNQTGMTNANSLAQMISESEVGIPQAPSDETRAEWTQIHTELQTAKEELQHIHTQIAQHTEARNTLAQHEQQHLARIQELQQHQHAIEHRITQLTHEYESHQQTHVAKLAELDQRMHAKQAEVDAYEATITRVRERARIWQMAEHMPFWLALIKHEMAQQRISADSLAFLQQLYTLAPQEALATLVEIEARTGKTPQQPYNLDGLHGEVRLFAATANARTLHRTDNTTAIGQLVDAWELFLKESK
jgi:tetratricopeptide (TPR) repeat protein